MSRLVEVVRAYPKESDPDTLLDYCGAATLVLLQPTGIEIVHAGAGGAVLFHGGQSEVQTAGHTMGHKLMEEHGLSYEAASAHSMRGMWWKGWIDREESPAWDTREQRVASGDVVVVASRYAVWGLERRLEPIASGAPSLKDIAEEVAESGNHDFEGATVVALERV